jgi:hypothetical protein
LAVVSAMKLVGLGAWMFATACWALAPERAERNPTPAGDGITIPRVAAIRSIRWSSANVATLARRSSLVLWSAVPRSIARPMLAPSFRTSTCMATIPASITPSTGIQARPRMSLSSS